MANPVFTNSPVFKTPNGYPSMPGYQVGQQNGGSTQYADPHTTQYGSQAPYGGSTQYANPGQGQYGAPATYGDPNQVYNTQGQTPIETGRVCSYNDIIVRAGAMFAAVTVAGAVCWSLMVNNPKLGLILAVLGVIGGLVLGLVNAFKREPSPVLIIGYAIAEGLFLGAISFVFEMRYPGIVLQAVVATLVTAGVMMALYTSGKVRMTPKLNRIMIIGIISYLAFTVVNLVLSATGLVSAPGGVRGLEIAGIPLGVIIGALAVVLACISLISDFDVAQRLVEGNAPVRYSWTAAFGFTVTLIWLYVEILRILSYLRD